MYILTVILHVLVCFLLIGVVLLQAGKGADAGITFGGSSQTLFGSRGAATFLSKVTIGTAVLYFLTSIGLTLLKQERSVFSSVDEISATSTATSTATSSPLADVVPNSMGVTHGEAPSSPPPATEAVPMDAANPPLESNSP